ncbi:nuclear transport factor 2 family protein [Novosphingobium sp.]|uniref:nuclear transport factor 2 family protein n=1 Tax=Novosphingobium sp. TaxID=1874826 RepID=UPI0027372542|nr:nuclear transport factor 2 family protein [Novosphingobium sp.]MDP3908385.1 nuclear transport factor 2 family protein [Novosphingobium sp.]
MTSRFWLAAGLATVAITAPALAQDDHKPLFQARYTELRTALQAKDTATARAILAPGYELTDIRGEVQNADAMLERTGRMPGGASPSFATEVLAATVNGPLATVEQKLSAGMTRPGSDAKMELEVTSTDTWVRQGETWLLWRSKQTEMIVKRDGEVMFSQKN